MTFYKISLIFSVSILLVINCSKENESNSTDKESNTLNEVVQTDDKDNSTTSSSESSNESNNSAEAGIYLGTKCNEISYSTKPKPDYIEGDYSYYTYGWQSDGSDQNS